MSNPLKWHVLPLERPSELPPLLVAMNTSVSSYEVYISDLANIWTESLDRKAIIKRGWDVDLSIDPSDTPENMTMFLSSIKSALDPITDQGGSSSIILSPGASTGAGEDMLRLDITCELPGFEPLKWPVNLKKAPPSTLASSFVLPIVEAQHSNNAHIESLIQTLHHKDAVLAKLLDKLEATGITLDQVFNALSGKKKINRLAAEDKVKGLAPFHRAKWQKELKDDSESESNTPKALLERVFGDDGLRNPSSIDFSDSQSLDSWWHDFEPRSRISSKTAQTTTAKFRSEQNLESSEQQSTSKEIGKQQDDDDDFQVQATPPKKKHLPVQAEPLPDDASTADEDDDEGIKPPSPKRPVSKIGKVGGAKGSASSRSPPRTTTTPEKPRDKQPSASHEALISSHGDDETASEPEDDDPDATASLPDSSPPPPPPKPAEKQGIGIGKIGGGRKIGQVGGRPAEPVASSAHGVDGPATTSKENVDEEHEGDGSMSTATASKRIGVIGKIGGGATARGRPAAAADKGTKRETSQERVERKREEMNRELEKKATGPAKKKRKF